MANVLCHWYKAQRRKGFQKVAAGNVADTPASYSHSLRIPGTSLEMSKSANRTPKVWWWGTSKSEKKWINWRSIPTLKMKMDSKGPRSDTVRQVSGENWHNLKGGRSDFTCAYRLVRSSSIWFHSPNVRCSKQNIWTTKFCSIAS